MSQPHAEPATAVAIAPASFEVGEPTLTLHADMPEAAAAAAASDEDDAIDLAALTASTYAALAASARQALANSSCPCEPWVAARARNACADIRSCKYVRNTQAIRAMRERAERTVFYSYLEPLQSAAAGTSTAASPAAASPVATSVPAASLSSSATSSSIRSFSLSIPQCPVLMHSGAGWTATGGGDATGYVLWPAAMFATRLLHSTRVIERDRRARGHEPRPCLDDTPFVSLELGCGSALVSQYLSLIGSSPPRCSASSVEPSAATAASGNLVYATDQNTAVWNDLKDRIRVRLHSRPCPSGEVADDVPAPLLEPALGSEDAAAPLQSRLQHMQILSYEWGDPLQTTPALSCLRAPHRTPSLLVGCDLVYFSIAYPKLLGTVWDLFENNLFEQSGGRIAMQAWMGKKPRAPSDANAAAAAASSASASAAAATPVSPLLFLCYKSRHAETEEDLLIALSSFAFVYQLRPEFIAQLQKLGRTDPATAVAADAQPADTSVSSAASFPSDSAPFASSSLPWPLDPLSLDCTDPFLRFFFAMPRCITLGTQDAAARANSAAAAESSSASDGCASSPSTVAPPSSSFDDDASDSSAWSAHLRSCFRLFVAAPPLSSWSSHSPLAPHWLLRHFDESSITPWTPDPAFKH